MKKQFSRTYLRNKKKKLSQKENDLLEIQNNRSAIQQDKKDGAKKDTAAAYLNLTALCAIRRD